MILLYLKSNHVDLYLIYLAAFCFVRYSLAVFSCFLFYGSKLRYYILDSGKPVIEILGGVCPSSADTRGGMLLHAVYLNDWRWLILHPQPWVSAGALLCTLCTAGTYSTGTGGWALVIDHVLFLCSAYGQSVGMKHMLSCACVFSCFGFQKIFLSLMFGLLRLSVCRYAAGLAFSMCHRFVCVLARSTLCRLCDGWLVQPLPGWSLSDRVRSATL